VSLIDTTERYCGEEASEGCTERPNLQVVLSGLGKEESAVRVFPVGAGSVLAARLLHELDSPGLVRFALAQSLLAARLRQRRGYLFHSDQLAIARFPIRPDFPIASGSSDQPAPVDRYWPSDRLPNADLRVEVESAASAGLELRVGTILDVWT